MSEYIEISKDPSVLKIFNGFKFISLTIKNTETGEIVYKSHNWSDEIFKEVMDVHIPKEVLNFQSVGREIVFSSTEELKDFHIDQSVIVHGKKLEDWPFTFGFVIPGSKNSWETIVEAADEDQMLPYDFLSGNMLVLTEFYNGGHMIARCVIRVFYD